MVVVVCDAVAVVCVYGWCEQMVSVVWVGRVGGGGGVITPPRAHVESDRQLDDPPTPVGWHW